MSEKNLAGMYSIMSTKNNTTTVATAKRKRNSMNSTTAQPVRNLITLNVIPRNRVFMLGKNGHTKQPYDVHGLADMVHHNMNGRLTELGRPPSRVPHTREVLKKETINAIFKKAKNTGWTQPTAASMHVTANNRRVPANLAAASAPVRAAIAEGIARQRLSRRLEGAVSAVLDIQRSFRRVSRAVRSEVRETGVTSASLRRISLYAHEESRQFLLENPSAWTSHVATVFARTGKFTIDFQHSDRMLLPPISLHAQITPSGVNLTRVDIGFYNDDIITIPVVGDLHGENFEWKNVHTWSNGRYGETGMVFPERMERSQMQKHASIMNKIFRALGVRGLIL